VVALVRGHPESAVQEQACGALLSITLSNKENRDQARHAGATEALAAVKERHKDSEKLHRIKMTFLMKWALSHASN